MILKVLIENTICPYEKTHRGTLHFAEKLITLGSLTETVVFRLESEVTFLLMNELKHLHLSEQIQQENFNWNTLGKYFTSRRHSFSDWTGICLGTSKKFPFQSKLETADFTNIQ